MRKLAFRCGYSNFSRSGWLSRPVLVRPARGDPRARRRAWRLRRRGYSVGLLGRGALDRLVEAGLGEAGVHDWLARVVKRLPRSSQRRNSLCRER
jgi:hypothetical protein